jgi:aminoglycoside phosphotransferase (APT) family kinase protein
MSTSGAVIDARATERLRVWFATQIPEADDVDVEGLDVVTFGHSAETLRATVTWRADGVAHRRDVVLRLRPPPPGLLEPYDLERQFVILRALEATPVRAPAVIGYEATGAVLGREFYAMEHIRGTVYERSVPVELEADPARIRRMSESIVDEIAAIHLVDLDAVGLRVLGDGRRFLDREFDHWSGEMHRWQRRELPALERLLAELRDRQPEQSPTVTLVHGDTKPGNFAFEADRVSGVFDWEMATVGDPLADIGWSEMNWVSPNSITARADALTQDELVARYQELTGIPVRHRAWYRAFQGFKMSVILFVAAMLFDAGHTDDLRLAEMGPVVHPYTLKSLAQLGIEDELESGPVTAREERIRAVRAP